MGHIGLIQAVRRMAARTVGLATDEVEGFTRQQVIRVCNKRAEAGEFHKLTISRKCVRFFKHAACRDAYALHIKEQQERQRRIDGRKHDDRFRPLWGPDEPVIVPDGLVVQICPPFNPPYVGYVGSTNVHGGNQRGRMVPEHLVLERMRAAP